MSLIEEALRRLQEPLLPPAPTASKPKQRQATQQTVETAPVHPWSTRSPSQDVSHPIGAPAHDSALLIVAFAVIGLTTVLVMAGAFWMGHAFHTVQPSAPEVHTSEPSSSLSSRPAAPVQQAAPIVQSQTAEAETPRAPFQSSQKPKEELVLSGVVEGLGEPYAVINGLIVSVGDHVGQATLLEISHGTVRLRRADGSEVVLSTSR